MSHINIELDINKILIIILKSILIVCKPSIYIAIFLCLEYLRWIYIVFYKMNALKLYLLIW